MKLVFLWARFSWKYNFVDNSPIILLNARGQRKKTGEFVYILVDLHIKLQSYTILFYYQIFLMKYTYNFSCKHYSRFGGAFQINLYVFHVLTSYLLWIKQRNFQKAQTTNLSFKTGLIIFNFLISYIG